MKRQAETGATGCKFVYIAQRCGSEVTFRIEKARLERRALNICNSVSLNQSQGLNRVRGFKMSDSALSSSSDFGVSDVAAFTAAVACSASGTLRWLSG